MIHKLEDFKVYKRFSEFKHRSSWVNNFYTDSSQLPKELFDGVEGVDDIDTHKANPWIFEALDKGKEFYFGHLKENFPLFYNSLINNCSELVIVEEKMIDHTLGGKERGGFSYLYYFSVVSKSNQMLNFSFPGTNANMKVRSDFLQEKLGDKLPLIFLELYKTFNYFSKFDTADEPFSPVLIEMVGSFRKMENIIDTETVLPYTESYLKNRVSNEMSVIMRTGCFDHILIDTENNDQKLYLSIGPGFDNLKELKNPAEHLDAYFSQVLMGTCPRKPNPYNDDGDTYYSLDVEF
ncbi:hypothetical protein [Marinicellulosiphila megalodicopiae]|uniref:hypothetical protein n=1 Tax=Marinicellulosiphila megalodicopiae TaxID=2724896 RepID=UPI003BB110B4